jgi:nucleoid-associated protein YgaU
MSVALMPISRTAARSRVDERTYRRRRTVAGALAATVVVLAGVAAHDVLAGPGGVPASAAGAQPAPVEVRLVARPGDTMWDIAERFHGDIVLTRYLDALIDRNGGPELNAGQVVVLP